LSLTAWLLLSSRAGTPVHQCNVPRGIASLFASKEPQTILNDVETYLNEPAAAKALT